MIVQNGCRRTVVNTGASTVWSNKRDSCMFYSSLTNHSFWRAKQKSTTQHYKGRAITYLKRMMMVDGMLDLVLVVVSLVLVLSSFDPEFQDACGGPSLLFSLLWCKTMEKPPQSSFAVLKPRWQFWNWAGDTGSVTFMHWDRICHAFEYCCGLIWINIACFM